MIKNLQYLRGFAAINVAYLHVLVGSEMYGINTSIYSTIGKWGANGVDIFFVISGFIMMYTQIHNPKKTLEFYFSRINRIVPIYWLISIFIILIYLIFPEIFRNLTLDIKKIISSLFFVAQPLTGNKPIIVIGWTLEWEMLFYFIFGLSLFIKNIKKRIMFIFLLMVLTFILTKTFFIFEFFLGILIAYIHNKIKINHNIGLIIFIIGMILLLLSLNSYFDKIEIDRFFVWGIPSAFIIFGAVYCRELDNSLLFYIGNASYSIYLTNVLSIPFFYKFVTFFNIKTNSELLTILCLLFTIVVGCFFYSFIEKHLKVKRKRI